MFVFGKIVGGENRPRWGGLIAVAALLLTLAWAAAALPHVLSEGEAASALHDPTWAVAHAHADEGAAVCSGKSHCSAPLAILMAPRVRSGPLGASASLERGTAFVLASNDVVPADRPPILTSSA